MTKARKNLALFALAAFVAVGCGEPADNGDKPTAEYETEQVCDGGAPAYSVQLQRHVSETGPTGNDIAAGDQALWIVESDANSVSRFELGEQDYQTGFVDVGTERNPYAAAVDEDGGELWVTNYLSETVTVADTDTGSVIVEIDDDQFDRPSSVALTDDYAYVGNVEYIGVDDGYGPGSISVVDRQSRQVVQRFETAFQNPHFLTVEEIDGEPVLLVSGSGEVIWDGERTRVQSEGGLEWLDIGEDPQQPPSRAFALDQESLETVGAPGRAHVTPDGDKLYFTSGIAPALFVFDVDEMSWSRDASDPIELYDSDGDTTHRAAMGPDGLLWVTAYNEDELHLIDTACDEPVVEPIGLGEYDDMLEGAQAITVVENSATIQGYYLLSASSAMGRVVLEPLDTDS